jgi:glutathione S-transferase
MRRRVYERGSEMKIELFYAPIACSLVPYITLTEANADFTVRTVNLRKNEQKSADYLKINPKHKVPVLVVDGQPLTENVAIQQWLDATFPDALILPRDPWQKLRAISLSSWCASGIHPYLTRINSPSRVVDRPDAEDSVRLLAAAALYEAYGLANEMLSGREFFFDHFTASDAHFYWCFRRGMQFKLDLSRFSRCTSHFARMEERPSVLKLLAFEKDVMAEFSRAA